ncbi:uncharacterized protein LOC133010481 [Limanda limanda]|uniref:uncharacterized protein LOC133010481 n=1 Tax=Limanda limanda TaxID=27771 RepID=UPI0029C868D6|nr:uncharacterized protein LOC133010481 [Limanda limanda]
MMKLLLSLTLIWAFSSTGEALVCQTCTNAACSTTAAVPCPTGTMCITASIQAVSSGTPGQQIYKACAPPSLCPSTGSQTFSVNLGVSSALASATCCSTDNCNSNTLPFPVVPAGNSLLCHVCNPITSDCSSLVPCWGTEDRCFQASVTNLAGTSPAFGCASTNMCAAAASLKSLPFMQDVGTITSGPACCGTSLCNTLTAPTTTTTSPTTQPPPQLHNHCPYYSNHRSNYSNHCPYYSNHRPYYSNHCPNYSNHCPYYSNHRSNYSNHCPYYCNHRPYYSNHCPYNCNHCPNYSADSLLEQLFSQDPSSEPEEDAKEADREADGQPDGGADWEEDRDDFEDDVEDNLEDEVEDNGDDKDYDLVGDASADSSSLEEEEEGQDHGCTTTPTGLVEGETFQ